MNKQQLSQSLIKSKPGSQENFVPLTKRKQNSNFVPAYFDTIPNP